MDLTIRLQILKDAGQLSSENFEGILRIIEMFQRELNIKLTEENGAMLITHLAVAVERIKRNEPVDSIDADIYEEVKNSSRFKGAGAALKLVEGELGIDIPENEKTFIMMHICALFENEDIKLY